VLDQLLNTTPSDLRSPAVLVTVGPAGEHHDTAASVGFLPVAEVLLLKSLPKPLGEIVAVEDVAPPVALRVVDACFLLQHLLTRVDRGRRRYVAEAAAVTAAGGDVDDVVAEALLVQLGGAQDALRRVDVRSEAALFFAIFGGSAVPTEKVSVRLGGEAVVNLVPTVVADEALLPKVDSLPMTALDLAEFVERGVLTEVLDYLAVLVDEADKAVVPPTVRVPLGV